MATFSLQGNLVLSSQSRVQECFCLDFREITVDDLSALETQVSVRQFSK